MKVHIDIDHGEGPPGELELELSDEATLDQFAARAAEQLDVPQDDILQALGLSVEEAASLSTPAGPALTATGHRLRIRTVCIELHFTSEQVTHRFPARAHWSVVHRWGCAHFRVPADACAQLELRDGAPDGGLINERKPIGEFTGCKVVWLVRPGAEPNG